MSPDDIHSVLLREYPELRAKRRKNPYGWAFYLGPPKGGRNSNRIIRATRASLGGVTQLKLSVLSRHGSKEIELSFVGNEVDLRKHVESELALFREHFEAA